MSTSEGLDMSSPGMPGCMFPAAQPMLRKPENIVPAWVLPLLRLRRNNGAGNLAQAWARLPRNLSPGTAMPDEEEAAAVLLLHDLV